MTERLNGQNGQAPTVLVVGGTSGINRGIAEGFARDGARVAVVSRSEDKVRATLPRRNQ